MVRRSVCRVTTVIKTVLNQTPSTFLVVVPVVAVVVVVRYTLTIFLFYFVPQLRW